MTTFQLVLTLCAGAFFLQAFGFVVALRVVRINRDINRMSQRPTLPALPPTPSVPIEFITGDWEHIP